MSVNPVYTRFITREEAFQNFGINTSPLTVQSKTQLTREEVQKVVTVFAMFQDIKEDHARAHNAFQKKFFGVVSALATEIEKLSPQYQELLASAKELKVIQEKFIELKNQGICVKERSRKDFDVSLRSMTIKSDHQLSQMELRNAAEVFTRFLNANELYERVKYQFQKQFGIIPALASELEKASNTYWALSVKGKELGESHEDVAELKSRGINLIK